jgi:cytochrome oxidase Cu insertion factor (SCO1/SenC/PrrC family)
MITTMRSTTSSRWPRGLALGVLALAATLAPASAAAPDLDAKLDAASITPMHGQVPPPFTLPDLTGKPVSLADFRGRAVMLYFWATW